MISYKFNEQLSAAPGTEDRIYPLPIRRVETFDGPAVVSCWYPTEEELRVLGNGGFVYLCILGVTQPPVIVGAVQHPYENAIEIPTAF